MYANKLPQWGGKLTGSEWLAMTGMDRASVGILLSVAVLQIYKSCELDERAVLEQCAGLLLHVQYIARSCTRLEAEADGGPVLFPITVLDPAAGTWLGNSAWTTTEAGATAVPVEDETEDELPSITSSVDHYAAEVLLAAHNQRSAKILSPRKPRAGFIAPHQASPSSTPGPLPLSSPTAQSPSAPGQDVPTMTAVVPEATAVPPAQPLSALPSPSGGSPPKQPIPPSSPLSEPPEVDYEEDEDDTANLPPRESVIWFRF